MKKISYDGSLLDDIKLSNSKFDLKAKLKNSFRALFLITGGMILTSESVLFLSNLLYLIDYDNNVFSIINRWRNMFFCGCVFSSLVVGLREIWSIFSSKKSYLLDQKRSRHKLYDLAARLNEQNVLVSPTSLQESTVIEESVTEIIPSMDSADSVVPIESSTYFYLADTDEKIRILKEIRNKLTDSSVKDELYLLEDGDDISNVSIKTLKLKNSDCRRKR